MISTSALPRVLILLLACSSAAVVADGRTEFGGHTKLRAVGQGYPSDSFFHDQFGNSSLDIQGDLRFNISHRQSGWTFAADYQLGALYGESLVLPDDHRRWLDLTSVLDRGSESALVHRLDRLWLGYSSEKAVVRFGRQALSWGNGMFYAPMDLINPFDPAAVDTEYKPGDDMLYLQYLRSDGSDIQAAHVIRRDLLSGDVDADAATTAVKYHGFRGEGEFDALLARHYGDDVLGFGAGHSLGGAHFSGDVVITRTDVDTYVQLSTNLSYSWTWAGKNMTGVAEYHFNGFGQSSGRYEPLSLASNPDLVARMTRGESFVLGRHYVAGNVMIEMTPLWTFSPLLLINVSDPSALFQLTSNYSLSDNMNMLGSLSLPLGKNGSEFGGIDSGDPDRYLSRKGGIFMQLAWYF